MKSISDYSVGRKLLVALALSAGIALLVMLAVVAVGSLLRLMDQTQQQLKGLAEITTQNTQAAMLFGNAGNARANLLTLQANPLVAAAAVYDRSGTLFAELDLSHEKIGFPATLDLPKDRNRVTIRHLMSGWATFSTPIMIDNQSIGTMLLFADLRAPWRAWVTEFGLMLAAAATAFGIAMMLAFYVRGLIIQPLKSLSRSMLSISKTRDYSTRVSALTSDEIGELITHFNDMLSQIQGRDDEIRQLAFYDPLTGLPNRRLLLDRLQHIEAMRSRSGRRAALLFIDLDKFKDINDTLGHDVGDALLQQVAGRLTSCVRQGDTVARFGGDEFVVLLEELSDNQTDATVQTELVGEKIISALNEEYSLLDHELHNTASIGAIVFGDQPCSVDDLLKQADLALYQSKGGGRNMLRFFDPEMQAIVNSRTSLEHELRVALNKEQFVLYYQMQVTSTGAVAGAEVLLRWNHPQRGIVMPAEFIALAEESGLILPLGLWVLTSACRQLAAWSAMPERRHLTLAVNVSACQFRQADFVEQIKSVLSSTGARPDRLKLELTESLLLDNVDNTISTMAMLKALGVSFSLDDFGTGYSSLSYLKKLPLDQLKIDQSFVRDVLTDSNDAIIACSIVALAQSMGLAAVAEGVESRGQFDFLAKNGCKVFQGYYFSVPLPLLEFEKSVQPFSYSPHRATYSASSVPAGPGYVPRPLPA